MSGQNRARIEVRERENVVLASSMLHRDVEARTGEFRDKAAVETTRRDVLSLSKRLEEMDSQSDLVDAMILGSLPEDGDAPTHDAQDTGLPELSDEGDGAGADALPDPDSDLPPLLADDLPQDELPGDGDHMGVDILGEDESLPGDILDDAPLGGGADELPSDATGGDVLAEGDGDDDLASGLPAETLPDPDEADDDNTGGGIDLDALLAQTSAGDDDLPAGEDAAGELPDLNDPFADDEDTRIEGLSLEDGEGDGGPVEIGQLDISKLRARREEQALPAKTPAPLLLTEEMRHESEEDASPEKADAEEAPLPDLPDLPDDDAPAVALSEEDNLLPEELPSHHDAADTPDALPDEAAGDLSAPEDDLLPTDDAGDAPAAQFPDAAAEASEFNADQAEDTAEPGEIAFHKLTEDEAGAFEEISARAAEMSDRDQDPAEEGFEDDGLFAPDAPLDIYHDLDTGDDATGGGELRAGEADAAPAPVETGLDEQMDVDSERDRLAIFDLSGDTDTRKSDIGAGRTVEDEDTDMKIPPLLRPSRTQREADADPIDDQDPAHDQHDEISDETPEAEDEGAAGKPAKKSGVIARMLRTVAVVGVIAGGGVFAAINLLGNGDLVGTAKGLIGTEAPAATQPSNGAGQQAAQPTDAFAPIGSSGGGFEPIDFENLEPVDPRDLAIAPDDGQQTETLSEQLARAAGGQNDDLAQQMTERVDAPAMPAPDLGDIPPSLDGVPGPVDLDEAPGVLQPKEEVSSPAATDDDGELAFNFGSSDTADETEEEPAPAPAPVATAPAPRETPAAGSLDAAMAGFLSGYITSEELDAMMSAYTTSATTTEIERRLQDYEERVQELDEQMARLDSLEQRIAAALEQADRAEQMALGQNDLVVDVVRMAGKSDMAESLIVDLSRRIRAIEEVEPIGRDVVDHTLTDLNERVEKLAGDMGLIAQLAYRGRSESPAASAATAPSASAGDVYARSPGSSSAGSRPPSRLDPSKIPADVKKGDVIEGYGHVLDVMPTERGKMVVTENDSVIIE